MQNSVISAVALGAAITVCARALPIVLLSQIRLPKMAMLWLSFVPSSIMASIVAAELTSDPRMTEAGWSISALAAAAALLVGILSRSLFFTVFSGMSTFVLLKMFLP
ncbi:hypothetical protein VQ03_23075 [Methylobacterium tarhaniae]|uniref:Branched-chain amino acid ABC transporter n=1 Tax=Methylobacterium tarhaniae TaxID=1187852 RepID=A0A0J6SM24_9HYPH|nr:AzlD domain-containing protein [Methylobacterium tarhaniae]KMO34677.1 hypothetical protein VQ03_23075 [Methylobacterium tarhaniae]